MTNGEETEEFGDIDPGTLPISAALVEALASWSASFDRGLDMADPASSRWAPRGAGGILARGAPAFGAAAR